MQAPADPVSRLDDHAFDAGLAQHVTRREPGDARTHDDDALDGSLHEWSIVGTVAWYRVPQS